MRVLMLNGWFGYPPYVKRIEEIRELGSEVTVCGVSRDYRLGRDAADVRLQFGEFKRGRYFSRLAAIAKGVRVVRDQLRGARFDVVYCLGFEMALVARLAAILARVAPPVIYELHDIRDLVLSESAAGRLFRLVERWNLRGVSMLVVTSPHYLENCYRHLIVRTTATCVLENKLASSRFPVDLRPRVSSLDLIVSRPIRIGFFGALRCKVAWALLRDLAVRGNGQFVVVVRGSIDLMPDLPREAMATPNVEYLGDYADPQDIEEVYANVDVVWTAGFHAKASYRWARSCRYYFAGYFNKPMIAEVSTEEGALVQASRIGMAVSLARPDEAIEALLCQIPEQLAFWTASIAAMPASAFVTTSEVSEMLSSVVRRHRGTV